MTPSPKLGWTGSTGGSEMKPELRFLGAALVFAAGLVCCLASLAFLVSFADAASLEDMGEADFVTFAALALVGIPLALLGMKRLSQSPAP